MSFRRKPKFPSTLRSTCLSIEHRQQQRLVSFQNLNRLEFEVNVFDRDLV